MVETIIWFIVSVPVLSVLMALVAPSVSTSARFLTTALASASFLRPLGQQGGDEGRHAGGDRGDGHGDAEQEDVGQRQAADRPDDDDDGDRRPRDDADDRGQLVELLLQRRPRARDRGQHGGDLAHLGLHAGGRDDHDPGAARDGGVLEQHARAIAEGRSALSSMAVPLATGALSPVRAASWVSHVAERIRRPSAGTRSPASTWTMSPGTTSSAGMSTSWPSRTTRPEGPAASTGRRRWPGR